MATGGAWAQELKERVDLVAFAQSRGVVWKTTGSRPQAFCPFHDDGKSPSFTAYPNGRGGPHYRCFGCGWRGDVFDFAAAIAGFALPLLGENFRRAAEEVAAHAGVKLPERRSAPEDDASSRAAAEERQAAEAARAALDVAQVYFVRCLEADREEAQAARGYVLQRGLLEAAQPWGLGFAPGTGGLLAWLVQKGIAEETALAAGLLRRGDNGEIFEFFRKRLTIPLRNERGAIVGFTARDLTGDARSKYLNTPEIAGVFEKREILFGLHLAGPALRKTDTAVLAEGQIDVIRLHLAGHNNAVALQSSALTEEQARLLAARCRRVIVLTDGDAAGEAAAERALPTLIDAGLTARYVPIPAERGKDPDEVLSREGGAAWLAEALADAEDLLLWRLKRIAAGAPEGMERARALREQAAPLLARLPDADREALTEAAARIFGVKPQAVTKALGLRAGRARERRLPPGPAELHPPGDADGILCTDLGNSRRLVRYFGDDLLYCHEWEKWIVWDGRRWSMDRTGAVMRHAEKTVRKIHQEALAPSANGSRRMLASWAVASEAAGRLTALVALARHQLPVLPEEFDRDPWELQVANGTLNLRTQELREPARSDRNLKLCPVAWEPEAPCPQWISFLRRVCGDDEQVAYLQRAAGYSLTGDISEEVFFFCHGAGANGKSTFLETLRWILGDYATVAAPSVLELKATEAGPSPDIAGLMGARMVIAPETEDGRPLAESLVKRLTGRDRIKARLLHRDFFEFDPTGKFWIAGNHKPAIRGQDEGIWRRVHLIPWNEVIPVHERDRGLREKLRREARGILAWAVAGCVEWQRHGLNPPESVLRATRQYRSEQDVLGRFLDEACEVAEGRWAWAADLYKAFEAWGGGWKQKRFGQALKERGFVHARRTGGRYVWEGITLAAGENPQQSESPVREPEYRWEF